MGIFDRFKVSKKVNEKTNTHEEEMENLDVLSEEEEEEDFINWFNPYIKRKAEMLDNEESVSHYIGCFFFSDYPNYQKRWDRLHHELWHSNQPYGDNISELARKPYNKLLKSAGWHFAELDYRHPYVLMWNAKDMDSNQQTKLITAKDMAKYDTRDTEGMCNFLKEYYKKVKPDLSQKQKKHKYFSVLYSEVPEKYINTRYDSENFASFYLHYLSTKGITVCTNEVTVLNETIRYLDVYYDKLDMNKK